MLQKFLKISSFMKINSEKTQNVQKEKKDLVFQRNR